MKDYLFVIDGFLSNYQRVSVCDELITQLRKFFPNKKILLLNKYSNSYGLESKVDYYFYYGDGFMVGQPPNELVENNRYSRPYVYYETDAGILENWMPFVGVSDHVANVYNGFLISSQLAKIFGYEKVFRIEYDMLFDENEIGDIKEKLEKFETEDYLIFGRRKEGSWAAQHLSLIDLHFCGYSHKIFEDFDIIKNDDDYWKTCDRIRYWGKWCEYFLSMVFEINLNKMIGTEYHGFVRTQYPKSDFDRISSSGFWEDKWLDVPKICRVTRDKGLTDEKNEIIIFYKNGDSDLMHYDVKTNFDYNRVGSLKRHTWFFDTLIVQGEMKFQCHSEKDGKKHYYEKTITIDTIPELNTRFLFK